ncbi:23 kDa integral membrane protein-like isoform X2 [Ischnura elegans]|uniref:23 kDa integral membrane protein-like isoform X2 n=1 Tax=Ischnura elegans TaxID=197161 RepID=UPI001ED8962A|nr:23 kDa integral membrane protein-like isoform X2 [Ischnura elegans]
MGFAMSTVKLVVFIFNLLCAIAGLVLIIMGALVQAKMTHIVDVLDDGKFAVPSIVAIVVGSIVFILSFLGCCGAARESHGMLISYSVILCAIFVVEIVIAALAFVYKSDFERVAKEGFHDLYADYDNDMEVKKAVDGIQQFFECCGLDGPNYFKPSNFPASCCTSDTKNCSSTSKGVYKRGCVTAVTDFGSWAGTVVGWVAIGICVVEVLGIVCACCLASSIKNESRRGRYA